MRQNESAHESFENIVREIVTDRTDWTELEIATLTCTEYVFLEREGSIKSETYVPDRCRQVQRYVTTVQLAGKKVKFGFSEYVLK